MALAEVGEEAAREVRRLLVEAIGEEDSWAPEVSEWVSDEVCALYAKAHKDAEKAAARMADTARWREQSKPRTTPCPQCIADATSHSLRFVGFDAQQRGVVYSCFSQALSRWDVQGNVAHLVRLCEQAVQIGDSVGWSQRFVWVIDFHGFSLRDCDPRTMRIAAVLLAHYPERLSHAFLIDAPRLFSGSWSVVQGVLDDVTRGKISFLDLDDAESVWAGEKQAKADTGAESMCTLGDEMTAWLMFEMRENRELGNQNKRYWKGPDDDGAHDPRGVRSLLAHPSNPQVVLYDQ